MTLSQSPMAFTAVTLVIPTLCAGGAERTITNMANWWSARGVRVLLVGFDLSSPAFPLDERVCRVSLNTHRPQQGVIDEWPDESSNILKLREVLARNVDQAKVRNLPVISFMARMNIRTLIATQNLPCRIAVSERCHPPHIPLLPEETLLRRRYYPKADHVIFLTEHTRNMWGVRELKLDNSQCIPNPVVPETQPPSICDTAISGLPSRFILGAGRLTPQKQFNVFIDAFAELSDRHPDLHAIIIGEGPLRPELQEQARRLRLADRIHIPGMLGNVAGLARRAEAFVLTSAFEGFPNVLLECMAEGCPCIAFDCPTGPREIIRDGVDGLLAAEGDHEGLVNGLERLLTNPLLRHTLGSAAVAVCSRFSQETIMPQWESLFL